ncbi:MAG: hypothetical protein ABF289_12180 [Clostridiales bacterium]
MTNVENNWNTIMNMFSGELKKKIPTQEQFIYDYKLKFEDNEYIFYIKTLTTLEGIRGIVYVFCGVVINKEIPAFSESGYIDFSQLINAKQEKLSDDELKLNTRELVSIYKKNI